MLVEFATIESVCLTSDAVPNVSFAFIVKCVVLRSHHLLTYMLADTVMSIQSQSPPYKFGRLYLSARSFR